MNGYRTGFRPNLAIALAGAVVFALIPFLFNSGVVFLAGLIAINIVFALSWNLLFSGIGLLSFGHAMFYAGGAYASAIMLTAAPQFSFLAILAFGAGTGALMAFVFGIVALRRASGIYFAVLTLAFAELVHIVITRTDMLGRNDGLVGIPRPKLGIGPLAIDLSGGDRYYFFIVATMTLAAFGLWCLTNSPAGRLMRAIRQQPLRAAFLGVDVKSWRLTAFAVSGGVAGLCGSVLAPWAQIVSPEIAHWSASTQPILFSLLGGAGVFWGPAVGAILFGALGYATRSLHGVADVTVGLLLLAVVLAVPGGVLGLVTRVAGRRRVSPGAAPDTETREAG